MQDQITQKEKELNDRLYRLFLSKYDGNKSAFARASQCTETTVRRVFKNQQSITVNLLLRFAEALDTNASTLLESINLETKK